MTSDERQSDNVAMSLFDEALAGPWYIAIPRLLVLVTLGVLYIIAVLAWRWLTGVVSRGE
ncbi:hypothetical protein ACFQL1_15825 [Halomicroarcula sp. GCM10025709]|uniref:hypothetical protein n=1 Tax=Haloarcula TaxID=2237 RepID=UPI0024C2CCFF|nr:hypothetical protein [Halomicroarcula sp. YJ-61-S]